MGAGDLPKLIGRMDAEEVTEVLDVTLVGAAGTRVVQVGEPLGRCRHLCQPLKLSRRQAAFRRGMLGRNQIIHRGSLQGEIAGNAARNQVHSDTSATFDSREQRSMDRLRHRVVALSSHGSRRRTHHGTAEEYPPPSHSVRPGRELDRAPARGWIRSRLMPPSDRPI